MLITYAVPHAIPSARGEGGEGVGQGGRGKAAEVIVEAVESPVWQDVKTSDDSSPRMF